MQKLRKLCHIFLWVLTVFLTKSDCTSPPFLFLQISFLAISPLLNGSLQDAQKQQSELTQSLFSHTQVHV